jgi:hypothetical protein
MASAELRPRRGQLVLPPLSLRKASERRNRALLSGSVQVRSWTTLPPSIWGVGCGRWQGKFDRHAAGHDCSCRLLQSAARTPQVPLLTPPPARVFAANSKPRLLTGSMIPRLISLPLRQLFFKRDLGFRGGTCTTLANLDGNQRLKLPCTPLPPGVPFSTTAS